MWESVSAAKPRRRNPLSFGVSGCLHGAVLAWVILSGAGVPPRKNIYDQEIRPNEKKIIWYSLREKLPDITPPDSQPDARPARARLLAPQTMVAGAKDDVQPKPLIWAPEPEAAQPREIPLPNVLAVASPRVVRPFVEPPPKIAAPAPAPTLPDAPRVAAAEVKAALPAAPPPRVVRPFVEPPPKIAAPTPAPMLPEGPRVAATEVKATLPAAPPPTGPVRAFTPPPNERMQRQAMLQLPEGPQPAMVVEPNALPFATPGPRPPPREFVAPAGKAGASLSPSGLPAAPEVAAVSASKGGLEKVPRGYEPRKAPAMPGATPAISAEPPVASGLPGGTAAATLAIVGLNPAKAIEVPTPPASRAAGFSAGPETRPDGSTGTNGVGLVNVPGLVVKGGAKDTQPTLVTTFSPTSRENLLAAARVATSPGMKPLADPSATRVAEAPDPRLAGRVVYTVAIQMPNVTSFSGSWLVWFAEREPLPGARPKEMRPPEVVHKVDPKYVAAAVAERVEGTVRLFAVIRKDGHVGGITLIRQLDERLDRSAQEALAKWEFTAALRDGVPVDVDAVFEIPFHLAPRVAR